MSSMMSVRLPAILYRCRLVIQRVSATILATEHHVSGRFLHCRTISPSVLCCADKHTWAVDRRQRSKVRLNMRSLLQDEENVNVQKDSKRWPDSEKSEPHIDRRRGVLDDIIDDLLQGERRPVSSDIWDGIRDKLAGLHQFKKAWPANIMLMLANREPPSKYVFDVGRSLLQYYRSEISEKMNIAVLVPFILLCASQGGEERQDTFDAAYEELCGITDVLDATSALILIRAFSLTPRWEECFAFLDMIKLTSEPTGASYSPVVVAALKAGDHSTVEDLIGTMVNNGLVPADSVFETMMELDNGDGQMVTDMLLKMSSYTWIPSASVVGQLKHWFESRTQEKWTGTYTSVTSKGMCETCRLPLESLSTITPEDFTELRESFLAKSVKRGNVFLNSSPEELKRFTDFLRENAPFDIVVDALNVSHVTSQKASLQYRAKLVERVVEYFASRYKMKVLMMGRKHMKSWPVHILGRIEELAGCFYAENVSADDPFMLYAALYSGQRTLIVTKDELRDHRFLLGSELATKFKKWQRGHQMAFEGVFRKPSGQEALKFTWPDIHETAVQQAPGGWHIPFSDGTKKTSFQLATKWLCLTRQVTK